MRHSSYRLAVPGLLIVFQSCIVTDPDPFIVSPIRQHENYYYAPAPAFAPLLNKKNDIATSALLNLNAKQLTGSLQAAWLPGKHTGILINEHFGKSKSDYTKVNHTEAGVGYISPLAKQWNVEIYAGAGIGRTRNVHHTGTSEIKNRNIFIQPAFFYNNESGSLQFGIISRFNRNHFRIEHASFDKDREPDNALSFDELEKQPNHLFWEPGFLFRCGWNNMFFQTSYSASADITRGMFEKVTGNFSAGFFLTFNKDIAGHKIIKYN